jgi:uncharacterized protein (DUF1778 family)
MPSTINRLRVSLRVPDNDLAAIDQLARQHRMNRTEYMIRTAKGELQDPLDLEARFDQIQKRLDEHDRCLGF